MTGGTLVVSKAVKLYPDIKKLFSEWGFNDVTVTGKANDGLSMLIRELKPRIVFIGCKFYDCSTPYMVADLHKQFPKLYIAAISTDDFPDELAMYFIINGARSYVSLWDGSEQFFKGLQEIRQGRDYVSPGTQECIDKRDVTPKPSGGLTARQTEIVRLVANGYTGAEISGVLKISEGTVDNSKSEIYTALNVRNENEVIRVAIYLQIINPQELIFFGRNYVLKPKPKIMRNEKKAVVKEQNVLQITERSKYLC